MFSHIKSRRLRAVKTILLLLSAHRRTADDDDVFLFESRAHRSEKTTLGDMRYYYILSADEIKHWRCSDDVVIFGLTM